jgi:hypothetical protein
MIRTNQNNSLGMHRLRDCHNSAYRNAMCHTYCDNVFHNSCLINFFGDTSQPIEKCVSVDDAERCNWHHWKSISNRN